MLVSDIDDELRGGKAEAPLGDAKLTHSTGTGYNIANKRFELFELLVGECRSAEPNRVIGLRTRTVDGNGVVPTFIDPKTHVRLTRRSGRGLPSSRPV